MSSKLDIIDFINSSAIANHCRNIGYRFSALDMAYLIWASEKHSIEEKHNAWQILINTQPDVEVAERPWTPYIESLHAFLLKFMGLESKCLELFFGMSLPVYILIASGILAMKTTFKTAVSTQTSNCALMQFRLG